MIEGMQGVQCTTGMDRAATAPLLSFQTEGGRPFVTTGIDFAVPKRSQRRGVRQMLHVNFHVRCVKRNPFRSNQVTKSGGVQGEAECF